MFFFKILGKIKHWKGFEEALKRVANGLMFSFWKDYSKNPQTFSSLSLSKIRLVKFSLAPWYHSMLTFGES